MAEGRTIARWTTRNLRLIAFASGDFAFNLYWQSVMLYLLFYYTEALHMPIALASAAYAIASVWDGVASFFAGVLADRHARPDRFRFALLIGALPLGVFFVLAYAAPHLADAWQMGWMLVAHLMFRTLYAMVNVPYLAMSSRISVDSDDRALVAGARMLFGAVAAVVVAVGTVPLGEWLTGTAGASAFIASSMVFAGIGVALLTIVGLVYRDDGAIPAPRGPMATSSMVVSVMRNRAFLALSAAMMAMIVAVTVLDKSVLYYFKYTLHDENAGQLTLGWMMVVSGVAIPLWLWIARRFGARKVWFSAIALCSLCLGMFMTLSIGTSLSVQIFLVAVQTFIVGLHFAFWAILPDTVEFGQRESGVRAEAVLYGLAALFQRIAIGLGTLLVGLGLGGEGVHHAEVDDFTYKFVLALIPLVFFLLAGLLMLFNPMDRNSHRRILDELGGNSAAES